MIIELWKPFRSGDNFCIQLSQNLPFNWTAKLLYCVNDNSMPAILCNWIIRCLQHCVRIALCFCITLILHHRLFASCYSSVTVSLPLFMRTIERHGNAGFISVFLCFHCCTHVASRHSKTFSLRQVSVLVHFCLRPCVGINIKRKNISTAMDVKRI